MQPEIRSTERRSTARKPLEIKSLDDARRFVRIVNSRKVENNPTVKAWRFAKQAAWLLLLVVLFLAYYLLDMAYQALSLP